MIIEKNPTVYSVNKTPLDPNLIPKFVNQLPIPPVFKPQVYYDENGSIYHNYEVTIKEVQAQTLPPPLPMTTLYAYGGSIYSNYTPVQDAYVFTSPGPTFEVHRHIPIRVHWKNNLTSPHFLPIDPTLHWADPNMIHGHLPLPWPPFPPGFPLAQFPVPTVTHLHGGEVPPIDDGHPDAWFTHNNIFGKAYVSSYTEYLNTQPPSTLWYHDHTLGITSVNVYAGLAGFYLIRDPKNPLDNPNTTAFPMGKYEIPLVIQDRSFYVDGSLAYPTIGNNPDDHPYWVPVVFGDTIMVNGKVWPNLNVEKTAYRFRFLNGSNSRFYLLKLSNNLPFIQIGSDGGYLPKPIKLTSLFIAPGERFDVIIDFSNIPLQTKILLQNFSAASHPFGTSLDPKTTGQIMQFTVASAPPPQVKPLNLPNKLNNLPYLVPNKDKRTLTLNVVFKEGTQQALALLLDGQIWDAPVSENPIVGSTEVWEIVNLTIGSHPIHLHLVQFQVLNRQKFDLDSYLKDWTNLNSTPPLSKPTISLPVDAYLQGPPIPPEPEEIAWKDTVKVFTGEITRITVRFSPIDADYCKVKPGVNLYPFDPTQFPGYVWHCHMLDHEDNEMMRPYHLINS